MGRGKKLERKLRVLLTAESYSRPIMTNIPAVVKLQNDRY